MRTIFPLLLLLSTIGAAPAEPVRRLDRDRSRVSFALDGEYLAVTGAFHAYDGKVRFGPDRRAPSEVAFTIDVSKFSLDTKDPRAALVVQQLAASLPSSVMTFRSTSVKPAGEGRFLLSGVSVVQGRREEVSLPVEALPAGPGRSRFKGKVSGEPALDGPAGLLLGEASGQIVFTLEFAEAR